MSACEFTEHDHEMLVRIQAMLQLVVDQVVAPERLAAVVQMPERDGAA